MPPKLQRSLRLLFLWCPHGAGSEQQARSQKTWTVVPSPCICYTSVLTGPKTAELPTADWEFSMWRWFARYSLEV